MWGPAVAWDDQLERTEEGRTDMMGDDRDFRASDAAAAELVVDWVRGQIERGQLKPGDRLPPERELAQKVGVSRPSAS